MSARIQITHEIGRGQQTVYDSVIGYVVAAVVKNIDSSISLEREIVVEANTAEDNELAEQVVKDIETALNSVFPDPNKPEPSKLWMP